MQLRGVVKIYAGLGGEVTALDGIDLQVRQGEFAGANGKIGKRQDHTGELSFRAWIVARRVRSG